MSSWRAQAEEAEAEAMRFIRVYEDAATKLAAIPVIAGKGCAPGNPQGWPPAELKKNLPTAAPDYAACNRSLTAPPIR